jgi:Domain of unknown function (DUF6249)
MNEELIAILGMLLSLGMPLSILMVWVVLNYRKRRRLMELHHAERMAAIERGMEVPPMPLDLIDGNSPRRRRSSLLPGLVWFFVGLAVLLGLLGIDAGDGDGDVPIIGGLIPLGVGVAYLLYYFFEGRAIEEKWREHDLKPPTNEPRA